MGLDIKKLTPQERYKLIGKPIEEIKLRKYSYQTGRSYISVVKRFLKSEKLQENSCFPILTKADQPCAAFILP